MARMIRCGYCGKEYAWRPEMAGRKVRCKCGHRIEIEPETPSPQPVAKAEDIYALADDVHAQVGHEVRHPGATVGDNAGRKCPACGSALEASDLLCLNCGMNLKTGHRPSARPISTPAGPAPRPQETEGYLAAAAVAGAQRPDQIERADINPHTRKVAIILAGGIILLLGGIVGLFLLTHKPSVPVVYLGDDQRIIDELDRGSTTIPDFLEQGNNNNTMFSGMNASQARAMDIKLRGLGAVDVLITSTLNGMMVRHLVIKLPADPARRKALFDFQAEYYATAGRKVDVDVGQKYLRLVLNL